MRPIARTAALAAATSMPVACSTGSAPSLALHGAWMPAQVEGDVTVTLGGVAGTGSRIDVDRDLDLDRESQHALGLDLDLADARLVFEWLPLAFDGRTRLPTTEVFHGTTFPAGNRVETELELETVRIRLDTAVFSDGADELRVGLGAYWWDFEMELRDFDALVSDRRSFSRLLPAASLAGTWAASGELDLGFDASFATLGKGRRLFDLGSGLAWHLGESLTATAGYRYLRYELDEDTNDGTLEVHGPLLGLEWRF